MNQAAHVLQRNPNWWSINSMRPQPPSSPFMIPSSSFFPSCHELSWSQLLMGGFIGDQEENQLASYSNASSLMVDQENSYIHANEGHNIHHFRQATNWSPAFSASSPKSCVTSTNNNMLLDFSDKKSNGKRHPTQDLSSSEGNSPARGSAKKARVQSSSSGQSTIKVRKEKLGDRVTALHQIVSPFGKTDTASVLLETIGYIRFLQNQIEALSLPYMDNNLRQQQSDSQEGTNMDLRSRGLCLVPVSCTQEVGSDNGADFWAPALGGGFQ